MPWFDPKDIKPAPPDIPTPTNNEDLVPQAYGKPAPKQQMSTENAGLVTQAGKPNSSALSRGASGFIETSPIGIIKGAMDAMGKHPDLTAITGPLGPMVYEGAKQAIQNLQTVFDTNRSTEDRMKAGLSLMPGSGPLAVNAVNKVENKDVAGLVGNATGMGATILAGAKAPEIPDVIEGIKAAAPDVAAGAARTGGGAGLLASHMPGSWMGWWIARGGLRQMGRGISKGVEGFRNASDLTSENQPYAGEASPGPEAAPLEPAMPSPTAAPKAPGQAFAEADGQNWGKLSKDTRQTYADIERAQANMKAQAEPPARPAPQTPASEPAPTYPTPAARPMSGIGSPAGPIATSAGRWYDPAEITPVKPEAEVPAATPEAAPVQPPESPAPETTSPSPGAPQQPPTPEEMAAPFKVDQQAYEASQNRSAQIGEAKHMANRGNAAQGIADYAKSKGYDDPEVMAAAQPQHWMAVAKAAGYPKVGEQTIQAAIRILKSGKPK